MGRNDVELFCIMFGCVIPVSACAEVAWLGAEVSRGTVESEGGDGGWKAELCSERLVTSLWTVLKEHVIKGTPVQVLMN